MVATAAARVAAVGGVEAGRGGEAMGAEAAPVTGVGAGAPAPGCWQGC